MDLKSIQDRYQARDLKIKHQFALFLFKSRLNSLEKILKAADAKCKVASINNWKDCLKAASNLEASQNVLLVKLTVQNLALSLENILQQHCLHSFQLIQRASLTRKTKSATKVNEQSLVKATKQEINDEIAKLKNRETEMVQLKIRGKHYAELYNETKKNISRERKEQESEIQEEIKSYSEENQKLQERLSAVESNVEGFFKEMEELIEAGHLEQARTRKNPVNKKQSKSRTKISVVSKDFLR